MAQFNSNASISTGGDCDRGSQGSIDWVYQGLVVYKDPENIKNLESLKGKSLRPWTTENPFRRKIESNPEAFPALGRPEKNAITATGTAVPDTVKAFFAPKKSPGVRVEEILMQR
ncbi:hypothetical protein NADE_001551 [Nannochloris sp. 'desiccata']|nr:hypothetical protein KSW81_001591 [Chlorella desiccata (nom. nud.)]KAH7616743.1 hypothetical protein NADE_001551 [Chlorella desiccata (nom. nud.)]